MHQKQLQGELQLLAKIQQAFLKVLTAW